MQVFDHLVKKISDEAFIKRSLNSRDGDHALIQEVFIGKGRVTIVEKEDVEGIKEPLTKLLYPYDKGTNRRSRFILALNSKEMIIYHLAKGFEKVETITSSSGYELSSENRILYLKKEDRELWFSVGDEFEELRDLVKIILKKE